jgi:hypothetical protein
MPGKISYPSIAPSKIFNVLCLCFQAHAEGQGQPGALAYPIPGPFGAAGMVPWPFVGAPGQPAANAAPSSSAGQLPPGTWGVR